MTYEANTFCTQDPPPVPTITALDVANLINIGNPAAYATAAQKVAQLISAYAWYQFCECTGAATPAPPTPPAAPTGMPQINPPYLPPQTTTPCVSFERTRNTAFQPATSTFEMIGTGARNTAVGAVPIPNGVTQIRAQWDVAGLGSGNLVTFWCMGYNSSGSIVMNFSRNINTNTTINDVINVPANVVSIKSVEDINGTGTPTSGSLHVKLDVYCNNQQPTTPITPCCPPDTLLEVQIQRILDYVELIQRQIAPFASIDGPVHPGLSGSGHIDITDPMLAIRVELTTLPSSYGVSVGDPDEHFDVGFVALGDADEWFGTRPVEQLKMLWQPRWAGMVTRIGYTLHPGVVATITELRREF